MTMQLALCQAKINITMTYLKNIIVLQAFLLLMLIFNNFCLILYLTQNIWEYV